jgi:hypothetical protein
MLAAKRVTESVMSRNARTSRHFMASAQERFALIVVGRIETVFFSWRHSALAQKAGLLLARGRV